MNQSSLLQNHKGDDGKYIA